MLLFTANLLEQSTFSLIALFLFILPLYSVNLYSSLNSIEDNKLTQSLGQVDSGPKLFQNAYPVKNVKYNIFTTNKSFSQHNHLDTFISEYNYQSKQKGV